MKKIYTIVSAVALILGISAFVFMFCVLKLPDERIDEIGFEALFIFLLILMIAAIMATIAKKEYYNDAECWQPEKIKIPKLGKTSFGVFLKQKLIRNGFSEFSEYNDNPQNKGIQIFYLKERKKVLCVALIDFEILSKIPRGDVIFRIPEDLQKYNIARKSMVFMSGNFFPIIYCEKKNKRIKQILKGHSFQHSGFNVFPCVASLDERLIYVIRTVVSYSYKTGTTKHNNKKAVTIINSILND